MKDQETGKSLVKRFGLIGLTATVYRMDSSAESFNKWFKNGWENEKIVTSKTCYGIGEKEYINNRIEVVSISDLINNGILEKPKLIRVDDFEDGIPEDETAYLADKIKKKYYHDNWGKTIVFVKNTQMADDLEKRLKGSISCFSYTYKNHNMEKLENFKKPENKDVMISVDMVSEGFDVKDIETIYLYSKIQSQIKIRQRIGRVLRKSGDKKSSRVIWQKYTSVGMEKKKVDWRKVKDKDVEEEEGDIERDIAEWKKGAQIPAGIYLEKLPRNLEDERKRYKYLEFLDIMELFGSEPYTEDEGVLKYHLGNSRDIYFKKGEEKGYRQYYQMIMTDYYSELIYHEEKDFKKFSGYAKLLGLKKDELLEYVKNICFYMSNTRAGDTKGVKIGKRLAVPDKDIESFYEYVIENMEMPEADDTFIKDKEVQNFGNLAAVLNLKIVKEYIGAFKEEKGDFPKVDNLIQAMKRHWEIVHNKTMGKNKKKEYTDILPYGTYMKYQHNEMESVRYLMSLGAVYEKRIRGMHKKGKLEGEIAFIGKKENGEYYNIKPLHRATNEIVGRDLCLIAEALVTVPNRIKVSKKDVEEYEKLICENYGKIFRVKNSPDKKELAQEFLMALGYFGENKDENKSEENDSLIRLQCEIFGERLPRIVQYVIYCRCYVRIADKSRYDKNGTYTFQCQNKEELEDEYQEILRSYGITELDADLKPLRDVLYDYRPYLKAVPYYQGIKPEFLCRMLNDILLLGKKKGNTIVDAFGGSGAVSMNISEEFTMKQIYNDYGIMNAGFFLSLKNGGQKLKKMVEEFIRLVVEDTGDEKKAKDFFKCYNGVLENGENIKYDFINKTYKNINELFIAEFDLKVDKHNQGCKDRQWEKLRDRVKPVAENYSKIYGLICNQETDEDAIWRMESFLNALLLEVSTIFHLLLKKNDKDIVGLDDTQLGFVFFVYNSFVSRHVYKGATIDVLDKFVGNYEQWIDTGSKVFQEIDVKCGDALGLLKSCKGKNYIWYCDIPYVETSADDYSEKILKTEEFFKELSECEGSYIVSSRLNICKEIDQDKDGGKNKNIPIEWKNIIKFFNSFASEETVRGYEEKVKETLPKDKKDDEPWFHITKKKEAKYILFSFTKTGKMYGIEKHEEKGGEGIQEDTGKNHAKNMSYNTLLSPHSIRRMLQNIQFGNIPVEVMITDMDLNISEMLQVRKLGNALDREWGWYMPTFATDNSYMVQPVTIILRYDSFILDMFLRIFSKGIEEAVEEEETRNIAASFHNMYMKRYK